jgi:hypothetical protein
MDTDVNKAHEVPGKADKEDGIDKENNSDNSKTTTIAVSSRRNKNMISSIRPRPPEYFFPLFYGVQFPRCLGTQL